MASVLKCDICGIVSSKENEVGIVHHVGALMHFASGGNQRVVVDIRVVKDSEKKVYLDVCQACLTTILRERTQK